jgi:hypothetical protein
MSFKDSDFRNLVLTAAENLRSHYGASISRDEIARDLIVDPVFVNQLQRLIASCINEDECEKTESLTLASKGLIYLTHLWTTPLTGRLRTWNRSSYLYFC